MSPPLRVGVRARMRMHPPLALRNIPAGTPESAALPLDKCTATLEKRIGRSRPADVGEYTCRASRCLERR